MSLLWLAFSMRCRGMRTAALTVCSTLAQTRKFPTSMVGVHLQCCRPIYYVSIIHLFTQGRTSFGFIADLSFSERVWQTIPSRSGFDHEAPLFCPYAETKPLSAVGACTEA